MTKTTQTQANVDEQDELNTVTPPAEANHAHPRVAFTSLVCALQPGEQVSRIHRPSHTMTLAEFAHDLTEMKVMLRNNAAPAVKAARDRTGGLYSVEVATTLMPSGLINLVVVITRTQ